MLTAIVIPTQVEESHATNFLELEKLNTQI